MRNVGHAEGIDIYAPCNSYFSYFNSPYIGHELGTSIDIYPSHHEWGGSVSAPINGTILKIQKIKMGRERKFPTDSFDYGIAIKPENSIDNIVRILHCVPELDVNDSIDIGDHIGSTLRSRYFNYWTGPHYHVELMKMKDFGRASKSFPLTFRKKFSIRRSANFQESFECTITRVTEDIVAAVSRDYPTCHTDDLAGLAAFTGDSKSVGALDGGISHYKHGGLWSASQQIIGESVKLWNYPIGVVSEITPEYCLFKRASCLNFKLDGLPVKGLSCFIFTQYQLVQGLVPLMIIPAQRGQLVKQLNEGDVCILSLHYLQRQC